MFKNFLIAKEKFKPDYFLYENNKSAAQAIKEQISNELGVELMYINSALVSAQNRQRFYAFNWEVQQPVDKGILLKDVLDLTEDDRKYCLSSAGVGYRNRREDDGKLYRRFETHGEEKSNALTTVQTDSMVATPIRVGAFNKGRQGERLYTPEGKSIALSANGGGIGSNTGLYTIPVNATTDGKAGTLRASSYKDGIRNLVGNNVDKRTCVAIPTEFIDDPSVYEVYNGGITIKDKVYPIKLSDGYYKIRKLTLIECERLQTLPDNYTEGVSNTQRYKALGNGWTAEVIIHILQGALKDVPKDEEIVVLSMYDGIATGRYCLDKMGFTNVKYYAYEIDKYAKQIAMKNYPDIIQMGDAFDVRNKDWRID